MSASSKSRLGLGFKADGTKALDYLRSSVIEFGADVNKAEFAAASAKKAPWGVSIPITSGTSLKKAKNQLLLAVSETHALRFRIVYVYLGGPQYLQGVERIPTTCRTPDHIQALVKIWWRYGSLREEAYDSCIYCRIVAFASTASFDGDAVALSVGTPFLA